MNLLIDGEIAIALLSLTVMEIVLGIDNIIFISILSARLPAHQQARARIIGLAMAMVMRIILLCSLAWVMSLTKPLFSFATHEISGRDLLLLGGGAFLIAKATKEIHSRIEAEDHEVENKVFPSFLSALIQIAMLDMVFSLGA